MSDFSKGKWRYVEINNTVVIDDDSYLPIAFPTGCSMFSEQEYKANGRLIAAAPEMYKLLNNIAWYIEATQKLQKDYLADEISDYATRVKELLAQIDGEGE